MARVLKPQPGPQTAFLASPADIVLYGGAAGGGKSYALLLAPLRYKNRKGFNFTIFRREYKQIFNSGGLWDESMNMYYGIGGAVPKSTTGQWFFRDKNGRNVSKVSFSHIENDAAVHSFQGAQLCGIGFDELTHFTKKQFFYMLSRNRSTCGVKPFVMGTTNPDADSWVADFISWWIDQNTGYAIPERSGKIRWMLRRGDEIYWADTKEELIEQFDLVTDEEKAEPKSVTFIASSIYDNKELLAVNPQYLGNLKALAEVDRERLLRGNWKIKPSAGLYFKATQVGNILEVIPDDVVKWVRCWDLAATSEDEKGDPAYTAGVLMGKRKDGRYVVADVINKRLSADEVRQLIRLTAQKDQAEHQWVTTRVPQDPGQAGKDQAQNYVKLLSGFDVTAVPETGSKEARATPMAAQWQAGNFDIVHAAWNEEYLKQLENFPSGKFKDMVDASANAFAEIELKGTFRLSSMV